MSWLPGNLSEMLEHENPSGLCLLTVKYLFVANLIGNLKTQGSATILLDIKKLALN